MAKTISLAEKMFSVLPRGQHVGRVLWTSFYGKGRKPRLSGTRTIQEQLSSHVTFVWKYQKNSITTEELQNHLSSAHVMFSRFSILGLLFNHLSYLCVRSLLQTTTDFHYVHFRFISMATLHTFYYKSGPMKA